MRSHEPKRGAFSLTRRKLVLGGSLVGGALIAGYTANNFGAIASGALSIGAEQPSASPFGPFIRIDTDGWVTVVNKHQEMGQGTHAGLAAIVAEELDANWDKIRIESSPANVAVYKNNAMGMQVTAGSSAIAGSWQQLRPRWCGCERNVRACSGVEVGCVSGLHLCPERLCNPRWVEPPRRV